MLCSAILDAIDTRDTSGIDHFCSGSLRYEFSFDFIVVNHPFLLEHLLFSSWARTTLRPRLTFRNSLLIPAHYPRNPCPCVLLSNANI
jgi:hypothetical protein